jgi:hypothetical protein
LEARTKCGCCGFETTKLACAEDVLIPALPVLPTSDSRSPLIRYRGNHAIGTSERYYVSVQVDFSSFPST